jgi:Polysaccharide pyruvyl transferase/N-terminal domain of galactosyltransferase
MLDCTILCGVKDREEFLLQSIETWKLLAIKKIVVVDWGCKNSLKYLETKKIQVYRVDNAVEWNLAVCLNFGLNQCTTKYILKLDVDVKIGPDFFKHHFLTGKRFYTGNWKIARNENEKHLNGTLLVKKKHLISCGGYNENIQGYGFDDTDLYNRLEKLQIKKFNINNDTLQHIPHPDSIRSNIDPRLSILINMHITDRNKWNFSSEKSQFIFKDGLYFILKIVKLTDQEFEKCRLLGIRTFLNDFYNYTWEMTTNKSINFLEKLLKRINKKRLVIIPKNGLGNRLRAVASAAVLAKKLDRNFIIVWLPDFHCNTVFRQLFDDSKLLVDCKDSSIVNLKIKVQNYAETSAFENRLNIELKQNDDMCISSACVISSELTNWTEEIVWMRRNILPIPDIQKKIDWYSKLFSIENCIGMHIRQGQKFASYEQTIGWDRKQIETLTQNRKSSHYCHFIREVKKYRKDNPDQKFFICFDNEEVRDIAEKYKLQYIDRREFDRSLNQIKSGVIDCFLLSKCTEILGSPWSSFTELGQRLSLNTKTKLAGKNFGKVKYALIIHDSLNIGDDIQSLAILNFLPRVDFYIFRDRQTENIFDLNFEKTIIPENTTLKVVENGWFDSRVTDFRFSIAIEPLFIGFHLNETPTLFSDSKYKHYTKITEKNNYTKILKEFEPIGCRDLHTLELMKNQKIKSYLSLCPTLTFGLFSSRFSGERKDIYVVDSNILEPKLFFELVPKKIRDSCQYLYHGLEDTTIDRHKKAKDLLEVYKTAKYIITSRLHCALPALSFGTPVLFLMAKPDCRFEGYFDILGNGKTIPKWWNWDSPKIPNEILDRIEEFSDIIYKKISEWVNEI